MSGVPPDIYNAVDPVFQGYHIPTPIWETVAYVESGFNPKAVGDNGSSFGLFQLHRGGQLGNLTQDQAFDPATNAQTAAPAIAGAYNAVRGYDPHMRIYWMKFAELSGHPGGNDNDPATKAEAEKLYQAYTSGAYGQADTSQAAYQNAPSGDCSVWNPTTYGNCISGYIQTTYVDPLKNEATKVGIFFLALLLLIIGLIVIVKGAS